MKVNAVALAMGIYSMASVAAPEAQCEWDGKLLDVGETLFVAEPILKEANFSRDWSGFLMRCKASFSFDANKDSKRVGSRLVKSSPVMVMEELHVDYYDVVGGKAYQELLQLKSNESATTN